MEMSPSFPLPCLAMVHGVGAEHQQPTAMTLFSLAGARPLAGVALQEELKNKSLCPTPQGWMLVQHRDAGPAAATYLLDPRSSQRIDLPHLAIQQGLIPYCSCLLAGDPTATPGCPVLVVEPMATLVWFCRVGDGEWTKHDYDIGTLGDEHFVEKRVIAPIAACRGRFYFNAVPTETRVLDLTRPGAPAFGSVATEPAEADSFGRARVFMVATEDDELYKVALLHRQGAYDEAKVLRMDFSERRWRLAEDLGGRAFFVAPMYFGGSCCAPGGGRVRPDSIYSLVGVAKNTFRIFSVKDGTSQVCRLEEEQPAPPEIVGKSRPCWVLPTNPRLY